MENDKRHSEEIRDVEEIRSLVFQYRDNSNIKTEHLFSFALLPYYAPIESAGLTGIGGDIIYCLSEFVPEEDRKTMLIYPSSSGSLDHEIAGEGHKWDSLEDWREHWEEQRKIRQTTNKHEVFQLPPGAEELGNIISSRI